MGEYPDLVVAREGVCGCFRGPRQETAAEIRRLFETDGALWVRQQRQRQRWPGKWVGLTRG